MTKYFGTDGIRGKANVTLTADRAFKVGRYLGYYYSKEGKKKIVIGKDTRLSSDMLENSLAAGIASQGCDVYLVGYCPTPCICYLAHNEDFECGAMISASHNPFYDNGIKVFSKDGVKLTSDIEELIEDYIDGNVDLEYATGENIGKIVSYEKGIENYLDFVCREFNLNLKGFNIAMDCANGSASITAERALKRLGANVYAMNNTPNGININTKAGSTHPELFQQYMKEHVGEYDLGLMFDGDADRQILVRPNGELVDGDYMLYILAKYYRDNNKLVDNTIVTTVMANLGLWKAMEKEGINVVKTQVGDKYVYEQMCKYGYVVGGEQSGHIILKYHATTGDGLMTALSILRVMKETGKTIDQLCEGLTIYPQLLVNVKVVDKTEVLNDTEINEAIASVEQELHGNGRVLVRPSGTEPLLRVMAEAETDEICDKVVGKIARLIQKKYGVEEN